MRIVGVMYFPSRGHQVELMRYGRRCESGHFTHEILSTLSYIYAQSLPLPDEASQSFHPATCARVNCRVEDLMGDGN